MGELVISKVDKIYRGRKTAVHAVKALDLTVKPGEIVALLGSSGCGKTSTLRMIAGFEDVTSGTHHAGRQARSTSSPPAQRGVAMAFEAYSLYPPLTIGENIAFALKASRLSAAEQESKVRAMAEMLEIDGILGKLSLLRLRRPAAARQPRPRAGAQGRALSARRTDGPARTAAARHPARPHQALSARERLHHDPGHP